MTKKPSTKKKPPSQQQVSPPSPPLPSAAPPSTPLPAVSTLDEWMRVAAKPHVVVAAAVVAAAMVLFFAARRFRRADKELGRVLKIAGAIFTELTAGHSPGHDKKLFLMLHKKLVAGSERGLIRAMAKCMHHECGAFVEFAKDSVSVTEGTTKSGERVFTVSGKATFAKLSGAHASTSWVVEDHRPYFVTFTVEPPAGAPSFDVLKFVDPNEFEHFTEEFLFSLFKKEPTHALSAMCDSLRSKYENEAALAKEVIGVISVAGGLKTKSSADFALVTSSVVSKSTGATDEQGREVVRASGVELEFRIAGAARDLKATVRLVFVQKRCQVVRYQLQALKSDVQNVIVDQETGEKIVV